MRRRQPISIIILVSIVASFVLVTPAIADCNLPDGTPADDTIFCNKDGFVTSIDGREGSDTLLLKGNVGSAQGGTHDDSIISKGNTNSIVGDGSGTVGGNDTIKVVGFITSVSGDGLRSSSSNAVFGGNDSILIMAHASAEYVSGDGNSTPVNDGDDTIKVLRWGFAGFINGSNGNDKIIVKGDADRIRGDSGREGIGNDTIRIFGTAGDIIGDAHDEDFAEAQGGDDSFVIVGAAGHIIGDIVKGDSGNDTFWIKGHVDRLTGDGINENENEGIGGDDKFIIEGTVANTIMGDWVYGNGGNDTIVVKPGALVKNRIIGDVAEGNGGADFIFIGGEVRGNVIGDDVAGTGGIDTIQVTENGLVKGNIIGDDAGTPANASNGGDDVFIIKGSVTGTIYLDNVSGPTLDIATDTDNLAIDLATGGNDVIVVAGQITGNIASGEGADGDDTFLVQNNGIVKGIMDAGGHINGDSLLFDLSANSQGEYRTLADIFHDITVDDGTVTYRGNTYQWVNFEFFNYVIQLFQTRALPLYCSGIYEKNEDGTACQRKGQEEVDAIMFHRNNPGYDGRLPGTEACAVYNYGNAMRVYEVVDSSEGELVTTINADVFNHDIENNLMLASSASGNVKVYFLTSHEIQVECTDWTGKTQVRIIPDFSGTVNASFDKS